MATFHQELDCAIKAAQAAGRVQLKKLCSIATYDRKADCSPVTAVDRECERMIRERLLREFPSDGFLGEESGAAPGTSGRRWIVDPLDGTRPYLRGIPTFSTLIALETGDDIPSLGVIHLPALRITCWASTGSGAYLNGEPIRVSPTAELGNAMGSALGFVERAPSAQATALLGLMGRWDYSYGFMDAYSYVGVASGKLDCCVNLLDKPWDCAAGACIVTEAGGRFSDIDGVRSVYNGSVVLSNGLLHDSILAALRTTERRVG